MVRIVLVGFFQDDRGRNCEAHPFGCGNAFIERQGKGVSMLVKLHLVEVTHLAGFDVSDDGTVGCCVCFAAHEYAIGLNTSSLMVYCRSFFPDTANSSMRALYYRNFGYAYTEHVEN